MARTTKKKRLTSGRAIKQICPENKQLLEDFINYERSLKRSDTTLKVYRNDIQIAFVWNLRNNNNKPFVKWTKRNVVALQDWMINENGNSPARVRRVKSVLSSLSNYIEAILDDEYPEFRNIIHKIEDPALQPVREKTVYTEEEVEHLLGTLVEMEEYEKACVIALAAYSGRRKSELLRFKVSDFDDDKLVCNGALYKSDPIKTKGRGGGKYIPCYTVAAQFKPYLDLWMRYRNEHGVESEWLFPSHLDPQRAIAISTLDSWTPFFTEITGKDFYFHSLRHARTTSFSKSGLPDSVIQKIMGWESADMCRVYNDMSADEEIGMWFDENGEIKKPNSSGFLL